MTTTSDDNATTGQQTLPAYVLVRPDGVFIKLSPPPAQDILKLFVERLFGNGAYFRGLDYSRFLLLLYGNPAVLQSGGAMEVRIASDIERFLPQRKDLYKGIKIINGGERAEYMFEPVFIEVATDEPDHKTELQPTKLNFDEFVADMWLKGVRFGIAVNTVREAIEQGKTGRMEVALQLDPTASRDAQVVEENDSLRQDNAPLILPNGKADLRRARNRFPQVAKDAPLLRKIPRALGEQGYRVSGEAIEPRLPEDIDLNKLAGEGTRIIQTPKGELLVSTMDGFIVIEDSGEIFITTKIENRGGISAKSTGDIKLSVEDYIEHGEVQEGRVVEGKHMTFRSDVFGTILAQDGNIQLDKNLSGGRAQSIGGNITVKGNVINATLEAWDGKISAGLAEGSLIMGKSVSIERAVNCEIVAEELQLGTVEGCAIAGKSIHISTSNVRKHRETVISILLPDIAGYDRQIAEAKANLTQLQQAIQAKNREIAATQSDPGFAKYLAIAEKIRAGEIKFTPEQQAGWQKIVNQFAPIVRGSEGMMKKCQVLEEAIKQWTQERATCGAGESCKIETVQGETVVRKVSSNQGMSVFRNLPQQELKAKLQQIGAAQEHIFSDDKGNFDWCFNTPEAPAASA